MRTATTCPLSQRFSSPRPRLATGLTRSSKKERSFFLASRERLSRPSQQGFWDYQGEYIQRKLARGGHFSKIFAEIREGHVRKWILPHFKGQPIGSIRRHQIESWAMELYKTSGLVPASVNRVLDCMKVMMKEALRRGYVNADPAAGVESFTEKYKVRGIITPEEIHALFNTEALISVWKGERVYFVASLLGVATGLRQGEIRGLRNQDVHPQYVAVCGSWEERNGLHGAKWGSERIVPIPSRVAVELDALAKEARYSGPEDLVFAGEARGKPIRKEELEARFYAALDAIGINEESRRKTGSCVAFFEAHFQLCHEGQGGFREAHEGCRTSAGVDQHAVHPCPPSGP